jgi:hypothetical protein
MQKHEFDQVLIIVTTMLTYRPTTVPASALRKDENQDLRVHQEKKATKSKKRGKDEEEEEPIERTIRARVADPPVERKRKNAQDGQDDTTRPISRARLVALVEATERKRKADDESTRPTLRARTKLDLGPAKGKMVFALSGELFVPTALRG